MYPQQEIRLPPLRLRPASALCGGDPFPGFRTHRAPSLFIWLHGHRTRAAIGIGPARSLRRGHFRPALCRELPAAPTRPTHFPFRLHRDRGLVIAKERAEFLLERVNLPLNVKRLLM